MREFTDPFDNYNRGINPFAAMLAIPPVCEYCGHAHWPEESHAYGSFKFQANFVRDHGRRPTYRDAFAHCDELNKNLSIKVLEAYGVDLDSPAALETI